MTLINLSANWLAVSPLEKRISILLKEGRQDPGYFVIMVHIFIKYARYCSRIKKSLLTYIKKNIIPRVIFCNIIIFV